MNMAAEVASSSSGLAASSSSGERAFKEEERALEESERQAALDKVFAEEDEAVRFQASSPLNRKRYAIYLFMEEPGSSKGAFYFSLYFYFLIFFSTLTFCLESVPSLSATPEQQQAWNVIEIVVIIQFTIDYLLRISCAPNTWRFFIAPLNIIDLVAILPFYIEVIVQAASGNDLNISALAALRILRLARVLRLFKLGRKNEQLLMVAHAFTRSREGIFLLVFLLSLAMVFFSACIYFAETASCELVDNVWIYKEDTEAAGEPTPFQSIIASWWWAIVTMTTVGYGDAYPITGGGKFVAAVTMVSGLLVIAFPITIVGANLNEIYDDYKQKQLDMARAKARGRVQQLAVLRSEMSNEGKKLDIHPAMVELISVQHSIRNSLETLQGELKKLRDADVHAEALIEHIKSSYEMNLVREQRKSRSGAVAAANSAFFAEEATVAVAKAALEPSDSDIRGNQAP